MSIDAETNEPIVDDAQIAVEPEVNSESSTDSGENHDKQHDGVQSRINKLTAKRYQAEREKDELAKKVAELEARVNKPESPKTDIDEPQLPDDIYDEDKMREYHKSMLDYNKSLTSAAVNQSYEQRVKAEQQKAQQAKQQEALGRYADNAIKDGVDLEKLRVAETTLNQAGISQELGSYIMSDQNGGKIVEYLHDNPAVMHEVLSLDPVSAGIKIATEIKAQALSTTPKVSGAPDPVPDFGGGGGVSTKDDFERNYPNTEFI